MKYIKTDKPLDQNWYGNVHISYGIPSIFNSSVSKKKSLSSCKNFNVAHYLKSITDINSKLGILAHHDKMQLQDKGHNSECCIFGVSPFLTKNFK